MNEWGLEAGDWTQKAGSSKKKKIWFNIKLRLDDSRTGYSVLLLQLKYTWHFFHVIDTNGVDNFCFIARAKYPDPLEPLDSLLR